ncbi:hypothetical protein Taro_056942 [Colocasia esculenta]|uniref:Uncharacterized protein n=1 Tax=Colocasia esculenta TaxID=4460 RepID=A0A843XXY1_COLES|nr:hypothetical protein [Colocasia esculenta]
MGLVGLASWAVFSGFRSAGSLGVRAEGYFRMFSDSGSFVGAVFGPTLVVGRGVTLFRCFVGLAVTRVRFRTVVVAVVAPCIASNVSCEHERLFRSELRAAFLQVLGLFEFIAYLTGLNSNPSGSSDPWVAARPSGSLAGVREVGSLHALT